ncbi:MAG: ABC transporter ATP-binding protein [Thermodesulfovibrio sp.]|nr:ABC transporter ATP-binding protein [Thermodesulfovibrio sp.]
MSNLRLKNIAKDFYDGRNLRRVLYQTNLTFYPGELVVLSGPSGSGKTTLLSIMGLVLKPTEGAVYLNERDITNISDNQAADLRFKNYGFIFQQHMLIDGLTVLDNVLIAFAVQGKKIRNDQKNRAYQILEKLGLKEAINMQPLSLSGGMKQRVSIARALVKDPLILLCDEPTASLDAENGITVMRILKRTAIEERKIVIVVSHDSRVFPFADRLIKIENGQIVSDTREHYT